MARSATNQKMQDSLGRTLVPLIVKEGCPPIWVEAKNETIDRNEWVFAAAPAEAEGNPPKTMDEALSRIKPLIETLFQKLSAVANPPKEVELKLGLKLSAKVGVFVAESSGEATVEVKLKWAS